MKVSISLCALVVVMALVGTARAERGSRDAEAFQRFEQGLRLYEAGEHEVALAAFERAYEIAPNQVVLYNIARVLTELRRFPEALEAFERYLRDGSDQLPAERAEEVGQRLSELRLRVGRLEIRVGGADSYLVLVDGVDRGLAPFDSPLAVSAGRHEIEIRADGYLPARRQISVAGGAVVELSFELSPLPEAPGTITVTVNLPGAEITIDGRDVGTSPLAAGVAATPGEHVVGVTRPGYAAASVPVVVSPSDVREVEVTLELLRELPRNLSGELRLEISERGAEITIDGAPFDDGRLPAGPHLLEIRCPGFQPWSRQVEVIAESTLQVEATLRPTEEFLESYRGRVRSYRLAAYILGGVGIALLGTTMGLYIWNAGRNEDWTVESDALREELGTGVEVTTELRRRIDDNSALGDELQSWSAAEWALLGVGVAMVGAAAVLFFAGPNPRRYTPVSILPGPGGLVLGLEFD